LDLISGPVLRNEEKNDDVVEETFFQASIADWNRAVPMGAAMAIPLLHLDVSFLTILRSSVFFFYSALDSSRSRLRQIYMLSEETQLFACFMMFIGTTYSCLGGAIGAALDDKGEGILKYVSRAPVSPVTLSNNVGAL
jgi:hypothetical protein